MTPSHERLNELISGMLDGMLTDPERRELDQAMRNDPSLERSFDELQIARRSLLSGRSTARLGDSFSKRVMAQATIRAVEQDVQSIEDQSIEVVPHVVRDDRSYVRTYTWAAGLMTLAATILIAFFSMFPWNREPVIHGPTVANAPIENVPSGPDETIAIEPAVGSAANSPNPLLAGPIEATPAVDTPIELVEPSPSAAPTPSNMVFSPTPSSESVKDPPKLTPPMAMPKGAMAVLVYEISVPPENHELSALKGVLSANQIVFADDYDLDPNQVDALTKSRVVGTIGPNQQSDEVVSVFYLKATARDLDNALLDIEMNVADFPTLTRDLAMGKPVVEMMETISNLPLASSLGQVVPLTSNHSRLFPSSGPRDRMTGIGRMEAAQRARDQKRQQAQRDEISHVLLIVRTIAP